MRNKDIKGFEFQYDVCFSFAGEDREYVKKIASSLANLGIRVFYDEYEKIALWGKDLYTHLDDVYRNLARYCVLFVSKYYAQKVWTNHERQSAQARAIRENREYILPARFDETVIPGLRDTVGYIDLQNTTPSELVDLIRKKVGVLPRTNYFPPVPDRLFELLRLRSNKSKEKAMSRAYDFFNTLKRMSAEERKVVSMLFLHGCGGKLPENVHISFDLLRRYTDHSIPKLKRILGGLQSLGFMCSVNDDTKDSHYLGNSEVVDVEWHSFKGQFGGNSTIVAYRMITGAKADSCPQCWVEALDRLDFSQLASSTATTDDHIKA